MREPPVGTSQITHKQNDHLIGWSVVPLRRAEGGRDLNSRPRAYESPAHYVQESGSRCGIFIPDQLLFPVYSGVL